jgi:hypothetical protein
MKHPRRGVSLAELLVVMIACVAVISLSSQLICRVMRAQMDSRGHADVERSALRLSRQFRSDVHRTVEAEIVSDKNEVLATLELAGGDIAEYRCDDQEIERTILRDGERISLEEYRFPETIKCDVKQLADPPRLQLTALAAPTLVPTFGKSTAEELVAMPPANPVHVQIEAVLGRDERIASAAASEEASE